MPGAMRKIVAGGARYRNDLGKCITPGLSRFGLNRIEDVWMAIQDQIVKPANDPGSLAKRRSFPAGLRFPGPRHGIAYFGRRGNLHLSNEFSSCWVTDFDSVSWRRGNYATTVALL